MLFRRDVQGDVPVYFTVFAASGVPVHVVDCDQADEFYRTNVGTPVLGVRAHPAAPSGFFSHPGSRVLTPLENQQMPAISVENQKFTPGVFNAPNKGEL